jgi:hypothetical protein
MSHTSWHKDFIGELDYVVELDGKIGIFHFHLKQNTFGSVLILPLRITTISQNAKSLDCCFLKVALFQLSINKYEI